MTVEASESQKTESRMGAKVFIFLVILFFLFMEDGDGLWLVL